MDLNLIVQAEHFPYLRIQKGSLDKYAHTFSIWRDYYEADLEATYKAIAPHLPKECVRLLDIGSGLGGIDVLIRRHYEARGQDPVVHLLDGVDDPPEMKLHRLTFNNMYIARNFQVKNGLSPLRLVTHGPDTEHFVRDPATPTPFDLVVSFGSWCFHFPPSTYLPALLRGGLHAGTVVIVDVRANKPEYFEELEKVLEVVTHVTMRAKWSRVVFRVKPGALL